MKDTWVTDEQVRSGWGRQDFEIYAEIRKKSLQAYNRALLPIEYIYIYPTRQEADKANALSTGAAIKDMGKGSAGMVPTTFRYALCDCVYKKEEVVALWGEKQDPQEKDDGNLDAAEKRRYGTLKRQVKTLEEAIRATVECVLECQKHKKNHNSVMLKDDFERFMKRYPDIPEATKDIIRKAIRDVSNYRLLKGAGRPKKSTKA
jgi:hypothetical protein